VNLPGEITFSITEGDHYALYKLMFHRSLKVPKLALMLAVPLAALSILFNVLLERPLLDGLIPIFVGIAVGSATVGILFASLKPRARKIYQESASLKEEMALVYEDNGFRIEQPSGLWRVQWQQLARWDENSAIFAVFPNRAMAIIIPKQQVSEGVINFMRNQMMQSGLERPWRLRK